VPAKLYQSADDVPREPRVVALGTFDGVHLGHQALVGIARERAAERGVRSAAATFHPRPMSVLVPDRAPEILASLARRVELLSETGVDDVVIVRFTRALAERTARQFVDDVLVGHFGAVGVVVGANFRFGHGREGDPALLAELGRERGFDVAVAPLVEVEGETVSSSRIRAHVQRGEVEVAGRLLGHAPGLEGAVVRGDGRGRELGVPTANVGLPHGHVVPAEGVYAGHVILPPGVRREQAAISVGTNPTFAGVRAVRVEAHILDFDEDIYGDPIRVEFDRFIRGQVAFSDVDELIVQMQKDIAAARNA
jgi:riboflavin kinase/FMN adenylyltransferase